MNSKRSAGYPLPRGIPTNAATVLAIRLNPADIEVLAKEGQDLPAGLPLLADQSLSRGDAKVEYQQGWLDASLGSALARARAALLGDQDRAENPPGDQR